MDIKTFLRAPESGVADLGLSKGTEASRELLQLAKEISALKQQLKQLKNEKSAVAKKFKAVEQGTQEQASLIAQMKEVTESYKAIESSLKTREKVLREQINRRLVPEKHRAPPFYTIPQDSHYSEQFTIRELKEAEQGQWSEFVARITNCPTYCKAPWAEVIVNAFDRPTRIWAVFSSKNEILGGIPLTTFDSRLFGRFAVSVPYFNYGAVLTPYFNVAKALLEHLKKVCETERFSHIEVRTMQPGLGPNPISKKVSMVLSLPNREEMLDQQLGSKVRAQCKKAEPFQPRIRFGGVELLDDFYRVFAINMRDLGTPVYSKKWFRNILSHQDIHATLVVVYIEGRAVSAGFLVGYNGMLEIPWASTVKSANAMDSNMWMYREILDYAVRVGYEFFDFGRSTRDAGTFRFKKQWGAHPYEHYWYYILPDEGKVPSLNPDNPKYKLLISVWKRLPLAVANLIGPFIVKSIP